MEVHHCDTSVAVGNSPLYTTSQKVSSQVPKLLTPTLIAHWTTLPLRGRQFIRERMEVRQCDASIAESNTH